MYLRIHKHVGEAISMQSVTTGERVYSTEFYIILPACRSYHAKKFLCFLMVKNVQSYLIKLLNSSVVEYIRGFI